MEMNGPLVRLIEQKLSQALAELGEELEIGLHIVPGVKYNARSAKFTVEAAVLDRGGNPVTEAVQDWAVFAVRHGFAESDLYSKFVWGGVEYTIQGWLRKSHRYPVLVERTDGRQSKMPVEMVLPVLKMRG